MSGRPCRTRTPGFAAYPHELVSSTLPQLPRVNLYWKLAVGTTVIVSVQVPVPVLIIG
jgi:hypothetical protein